MAINISNYYAHHIRRVRIFYLTVFGGVVPILFVIGAILSQFNLAAAASIAVVMLLLNILLMQPILHYALKPIGVIVRAITETKENHDFSASDIQKIGDGQLGTVINAIHLLGQEKIEAKTEVRDLSAITKLLDELPVGVIELDEERTVTYHNKRAPVRIDPSGKVFVQLLFDQQGSLEKWLAEVEEKSIRETKLWTRIQNSLPEQSERSIYDVLVEFDNSTVHAHTTIITIDRTDYYRQDEESMDFIALAAHELRGPITVIRGSLDILEDEVRPKLDPEQAQLLERLSVSATRLSGYINNILNVSRFDRRHLQLHLNEDTIQSIYATIAHDLDLRATTQRRKLVVEVPEDLPSVAADRNSLSEVISNLVDNAIKYSPIGGEIRVSARTDSDRVLFSVQDFGIGMPTSVVGQLFNRFYRSHRSRQTVSGTGLGLYISKAIIDSHGGTIGVTSKEGEGSTFTFSLPTYASMAEKLAMNNSSNQGIIDTGEGWIKNHAMYKG